MSPAARTELEATPASAAAARRFVRDLLAAWDCETDDEVAVLLTSELVSNAVRHAASRLALDVRCEPENDLVRVEVHDADERLPVVRSPDPDAVGGRGLFLVESLARRWGAEPEGAGKVVWFELGGAPAS
jgi:anti-sigma regulatory factor (Ser/Thr protein kinase)